MHLKVKAQPESEAPKAKTVEAPKVTIEEPEVSKAVAENQMNRKQRLMLKKRQDRELYGAPMKKRMQSEKREETNLMGEEEKDEDNKSEGVEAREVIGLGMQM